MNLPFVFLRLRCRRLPLTEVAPHDVRTYGLVLGPILAAANAARLVDPVMVVALGGNRGRMDHDLHMRLLMPWRPFYD